MRTIGVLPWLSMAAFAVGCSSTSTTPTPDAGGADSGLTFTFAPAGCQYSVPAPATRNYVDYAIDDTSPVDATSGTPQRVRIGLGGAVTAGAPGYADPTSTAAMLWETAAANHAAKVKIGTDPNTLTEVHTGFSYTEPAAGFSPSPTFFHEVHVCGLKPGTTYYYQVGGGPGGSEVWSATQSFTTVPNAGKITVGALGDARDVVGTWQLVQGRMRDASVAMQIVTGDIVDIGSNESFYTQWLDAIWKDPASPGKFITLGQQMMVPIAGNHENDASQFYSNFVMPGDGAYSEQFASFDVGNTHFTMIDDQPISVDPASDASTAILGWADKDLAAANANRAKVPFVVAISHRGLYSTSTHSGNPDVLQVRSKLQPLFDKYAVDLALTGHDHEYERSKPLKAGNPISGDPVVGTGTRYVICAGAGADAYGVGATTAYREIAAAYGKGTPYIGAYSLLTLEGNKLTLTAYGLKASGTQVKDDDVIDTFTLTH